MNVPDPYTRVANVWVLDAEEEIIAAKAALDDPDHWPRRLVAYHAQQAAEKAVKAALVYSRSGGFEPTHDLDALISRLPDGWKTRDRYTDLSELTPYATDSKYLSSGRTVTDADAQKAYRLAQGIVNSILRDLHERGLARDVQKHHES